MSKLGKILVGLNLAMSLLFAAWAAMLYLNRIDWTAQKGKDLTPPGALVPLQDEYNSVGGNGIRPADARMRANAIPLFIHERWLPYERDWYAKQLQFLETGATENNPARQLVRGPGGVVAFANPQKAGEDVIKMVPVQIKDREGNDIKLKARSYYDQETKKTIDDVGKAKVELTAEAKRDETATNQIIGPKGLNARRKAEKVKYDLVLEEYNSLRPDWLDARVKYEELRELEQRLDERVKELSAVKPVNPR
jgi:hypothetical protein